MKSHEEEEAALRRQLEDLKASSSHLSQSVVASEAERLGLVKSLEESKKQSVEDLHRLEVHFLSILTFRRPLTNFKSIVLPKICETRKLKLQELSTSLKIAWLRKKRRLINRMYHFPLLSFTWKVLLTSLREEKANLLEQKTKLDVLSSEQQTEIVRLKEIIRDLEIKGGNSLQTITDLQLHQNRLEDELKRMKVNWDEAEGRFSSLKADMESERVENEAELCRISVPIIRQTHFLQGQSLKLQLQLEKTMKLVDSSREASLQVEEIEKALQEMKDEKERLEKVEPCWEN